MPFIEELLEEIEIDGEMRAVEDSVGEIRDAEEYAGEMRRATGTCFMSQIGGRRRFIAPRQGYRKVNEE